MRDMLDQESGSIQKQSNNSACGWILEIMISDPCSTNKTLILKMVFTCKI